MGVKGKSTELARVIQLDSADSDHNDSDEKLVLETVPKDFANEENKLTCQGTNASKKEEEKEFKVRNMRLTDCEREGESASKIFHEPSVALVDLRENDYEQSNMKDF